MSAALGPTASGSPVTTSDVLTLQAGGQTLTGWQRVLVKRGMNSVPASFDIQVTERYPHSADIDLKPGQPCTVKIGGDLVLTGYVDRYSTSVSGSQHTVRIEGRSKSADLVDCSAFFGDHDHPSFQVDGGTSLSIIQALGKVYGVDIDSIAGPGLSLQQFNINIGETAWEIIDRLTRYSRLVIYDLPDGSMELAQAGTEKMASGFAIGQNDEAGSVSYSMDQRYSDYEGAFLSVTTYGAAGALNDPFVGPIVHDEGVPRFRKLFVVSEQFQDGVSIAAERADWEMKRRVGQSQQFNVTCDSWRDSAGKLWAPNHLAPIKAPQLKLANATWAIIQVAYVRDENGQHADLTLMPPAALMPEPIAVMPLPPLLADIRHNNPTAPNPSADNQWIKIPQ